MKRTLLVIALLLFSSAGCSSLFFYPEKGHRLNALALLFAPQDVFFRSSDGVALHGWLFRAQEDRGTILVLHGNAENISTHVNSVLWLVPEGYNVFLFDYRGYGKSGGTPSVRGVHRDAEAALETILALPGVNTERFVVLGQSIGGAIAINVVARSPHKQQVSALIVDSSFASYRLIAREKMGQLCITWPVQYPASLLFDDAYSPLKRISDVAPVPLLIVHGGDDPVVPLHHGELLYAAAGTPKELWVTTSSGHIRSLTEKELKDRLLAYLRRTLLPADPGNKAAAPVFPDQTQ